MAQEKNNKNHSIWVKIEKSFETCTSNYSHKYAPTVICDCGKECKYRNDDRTFKKIDSPSNNITSSPMIYKKYQTKKLIKDDKVDLKKDIFKKYRETYENESLINNKSGSDSVNLFDESNGAYNNSNYTQDVISNLANYLKIMNFSEDESTNATLTNNKKKIESKSQNCSKNEWQSFQFIEPFTSFIYENSTDKPINDTSYNKLIDFLLNKCDPEKMIQDLNNLLKINPYQSLIPWFEELNTIFFDKFLNGLNVRWSSLTEQKTDFDLEETCAGKLLWTIKLSKTLLSNLDFIQVAKHLLFEMAIGFINIDLNRLPEYQEKEIIDVKIFENNVQELLTIISNITGIDFDDLKYKTPIIFKYSVYIENINNYQFFSKLYEKEKKTILSNYKFYSYNFDYRLFNKSNLLNTIPSVNINKCLSNNQERIRNLSSISQVNPNYNLSNLDLENASQNCSKNIVNQLGIKPTEHTNNNFEIEANVELSVISLNEETNIDLDTTRTIPAEYSNDINRLCFLTKRFLDMASNDLKLIYEKLDEESKLVGYTLLNKCQSSFNHKNTDGVIISNEPITVSVPVNYFIQVESPHRNEKLAKKKEISLCHSKLDHNHTNKPTIAINNNILANEKSSSYSNNAFITAIASSSTNTSPQKLDQSLLNWIKLVESSLIDENNNDIISEINDQDDFLAIDQTSEVEMSAKKLKPQTDENVLRLRNTLYSLANTFLYNLIISPNKLKKFRQDLVDLIKDLLDDKTETFVQLLFEFLNENLFFKLLDSIKIEWSYRLKSSAATTVVVREPAPIHIVIRLSYNLLQKLSRIELIKMILHEMIHAFLGVSIGDFDVKHANNYKKILNKINSIVKLDIPIEHNYEESLNLAHVWICNICSEKRIRFYNIPPTNSQIEEHANKCKGNFIKVNQPK